MERLDGNRWVHFFGFPPGLKPFQLLRWGLAAWLRIWILAIKNYVVFSVSPSFPRWGSLQKGNIWCWISETSEASWTFHWRAGFRLGDPKLHTVLHDQGAWQAFCLPVPRGTQNWKVRWRTAGSSAKVFASGTVARTSNDSDWLWCQLWSPESSGLPSSDINLGSGACRLQFRRSFELLDT